MTKRKQLTDERGEVRELTAQDIALMKPAADVLPAEFLAAIKRGRPPLERPKKMVSLRMDQDVIDALQASGPGWQTRVNAALKELLAAHKL